MSSAPELQDLQGQWEGGVQIKEHWVRAVNWEVGAPCFCLGEKEAQGTLGVGKRPPPLSFLVPVKACASATKIRFYL